MGSGRRGELNQPVAVVGLGCRFPQAEGVDRYWSLLMAGTDAVTPVPVDRFDIDAYYQAEPGTAGKTVSRHGGFLADVFGFDAGFFGISPAEARTMDPQQRLLLQVAWEALEDAGIRPSSLAGSRSGVFVGQATAEYADLPQPLSRRGIHDSAGRRIRAVTAGRLSYALDLRGPSVVTDTACSSSLVAVHSARQSLLTGESDLALAAGVNIILAPDDAVAYSQAGMLAADGRCKFGDAAGDGFVRSEGIGVVVLKRLADALRDGDEVQALLLGSAVTNDGRASGFLLRPAVDGQVAMLRAACDSAGITPAQLDYVEAHGTGTVAGDEVELTALAEALDGVRPADRPLLIGSVKSNIGHAEAAAGIAGLIKAVLMAKHGRVPASLHYRTPHRLLAEGTLPLRLAEANQPLRPAGRTALVGVSSFGLSGTNAHVVVGAYEPAADPDPEPENAVSENAVPEEAAPEAATPGRPELLVLSARSPRALRQLARAYSGHLAGVGRGYPLRDVCASAALRRDAQPYRLWAVGADHDGLAETLRALADGEETPDGALGAEPAADGAPTVFVFPGQGSQWVGMGRELLAQWPAFRAAMEDCDRAVRAETGWSPLAALAAGDGAVGGGVAAVQPVLWAMEVALAEVWRSHGVEPRTCLGHSMGESAAARVAGALTVADSAAVICRRSALMARLSGRGAMLVVELPGDQARALADRSGPEVALAVENSPSSSVLAGDRQVLDGIAADLRARGVFCRPVKVDVASHSPGMDVLREDLLAALADLRPGPGTLELFSTVHGRPVEGGELDAGYWMDNLRRPVRYAEAVAGLARRGEHVFLEISPHPLLTAATEESLAAAGAVPRVVPSLYREQSETSAMARAAGRLFTHGTRVDWRRWYGPGTRRAPLPTYAWDTEQHREEPASAERSPRRAGSPERSVFLPLGRVGGTAFRGSMPLPGAVYLLAALSRAAGAPGAEGRWVLEEVRFGSELVEESWAEGLRVRWRPVAAARRAGAEPWETTVHAVGPGGDAVFGLHARLRAGAPDGGRLPSGHENRLDSALTRCTGYLSADAFLAVARERGYEIPPHLRTVRRMWRTEGESVARMSRPNTAGGWGTAEGAGGSARDDARHGVARQGAHWEAALQPLLATLPGAGAADADGSTYVPTGMARVSLAVPELPADYWSLTRFTPADQDGPDRADVTLIDADGGVLAEFSGITLHRLTGRTARAAAVPALFGAVPAVEPGRVPPQLPAPAGTGRPVTSGQEAPQPPAVGQDAVLARVAAVLGLPVARLDRRRSLREQGLDSIMAVQLRRRLEQECAVPVSADRLLGPESVAELCAALVSDASDQICTAGQDCVLV
ncbi:type I polyketide synthase [Kitasatospora sp. NPDC056138]|uniref:type I polyketide synthase n=1 Tax=Kitasatospora sp. NPDC056138 TaxID=3345724 RepID=UPI0035D70A56